MEKMPTPPPQQFCVRWNSYQSNLQNAFPKLLTSEHFVDVTLACENEMLKCHKVVLSACSTYFEKLLLDNPCQHPIIFMKDMKFAEMQSLVDFMYKGEVNVTQDDLPSLLKSAEALQIRGLCGSDQLLNPHNFGGLKPQQIVQHTTPRPILPSPAPCGEIKQVNCVAKMPSAMSSASADLHAVKKECIEKLEQGSESNNATSSDNDSNDGMLQIKEDIENDIDEDDSYFDGDGLMDTEFNEEDGVINTGGMDIKTETPEFAIANVSCQYDGTPGSANRRIRRSDEELRRAAECITRGQTFQTVSDQFNIPISTIRFYMARKGILPRRKRGRACAGPAGMGMGLAGIPVTSYNTPGNTSPIGPPYHIVHYKLPQLGVSKLK